VAVGRITAFLTAEELGELYTIDERSQFAIDVHGDFQWEVANNSANSADTKTPADDKPKEKETKQDTKPILPTSAADDQKKAEEKPSETPFELKGVNIQISRGSFVAVVGRVGSGKVIALLD
jgi:ATP-binding cassette, subfamily C (CFTR/MRP), member 1